MEVFWRELCYLRGFFCFFFFSSSEVSAYQPGPWCGSAQRAEQSCSHCPSRRHPSGCWRRCTAVGFQCCRNLSLPLSSSWVFSLASPHHQILPKTLCQGKTHQNNYLDGTHILEESSGVLVSGIRDFNLKTSSRTGEIPTTPSENKYSQKINCFIKARSFAA